MRCLVCPTVFAHEDELYDHAGKVGHACFIPACSAAA
jgi:hypothetical protein